MQICKALFLVLLTSSDWLLTAKPYAILCILFGHRHYMYAPSQECLSCLCFIRPIAQWLANHPLFARPLAHKFYLIFDGKTLRNPMHFVRSQTLHVCSLTRMPVLLAFYPSNRLMSSQPSLIRKTTCSQVLFDF